MSVTISKIVSNAGNDMVAAAEARRHRFLPISDDREAC
jgi:hypothetical protein